MTRVPYHWNRPDARYDPDGEFAAALDAKRAALAAAPAVEWVRPRNPEPGDDFRTARGTRSYLWALYDGGWVTRLSFGTATVAEAFRDAIVDGTINPNTGHADPEPTERLVARVSSDEDASKLVEDCEVFRVYRNLLPSLAERPVSDAEWARLQAQEDRLRRPGPTFLPSDD